VKFFWVISWVAQPEGTLDPTQQSPLASGQPKTQNLDRYTDDGLNPQPHHNPEDEDRDGLHNVRSTSQPGL
jgi:hypothetical protein